MADEVTRLLDKITGSLAAMSPGELVIEDCDKLESKVSSAISTIRLLQNMSTLVHKLPVEVLAVIFTHVIESGTLQDFLPYVMVPAYLNSISESYGIEGLARVCRKWRDAASAFPALWSTVYFLAPREDDETTTASASLATRLLKVQKSTLFKVFAIARAHHQYQDVTLLPDLPPESESTRFFRLIASRASHIEELHIVDFDHDALKKTSFLSTSFPNLQSLTLRMDAQRRWYNESWIPDTLFGGDIPRLRKLTLCCCPWFFTQTLAGLTHLCIANIRYSPQFTLDRLLDLLRACPQLEDLALVDCNIIATMPDNTNKILLPDLHTLCLGHWEPSSSPIVAFLSYLIVSQPISFYMWGAIEGHVTAGLPTIIPSYIKEDSRLKELRITRHKAPDLAHPEPYDAIISTPDTLQVDGRFLPEDFLFKAPVMLDLGGVQELWLGCAYINEPTIAEWRSFFIALPSLVTLVISRRPSLSIISALTLPKETPDADLLAPNLSTLRIYDDRFPSVFRLSIFTEQRDRRNSRLKLLDIISVHNPLPLPPPPSSLWPAGLNAHPSNIHANSTHNQQEFDNGSDDDGGGAQGDTGNRELEAHLQFQWPDVPAVDILALEEYVDKVDCMKFVTNVGFHIVPQWPPRVYSWLNGTMYY